MEIVMSRIATLFLSLFLTAAGVMPVAAKDVATMSAISVEAEKLRKRVPRNLYKESELSCIAIAVYHEARGESIHGQMAVASVILQRARTPHRWGTTACQVVRPVQFSFMQSRWGFPKIAEKEAWLLAIDVAEAVMKVGPLPELEGVDHYHAKSVSPYWSHEFQEIGEIGRHIFYASGY